MAFLAFSPLREYPQVKSEKVRWSWKNDPDKGMWTVLMSCGIRYYPYIASGLESLHRKQYTSFLIHQQDDLWNWKSIDCPGWKKERCQGHTLWPASTVDLASWWEQNRIMILPRHPTASPHGIHRQTNWALTKICLYIRDDITKLYREYVSSHYTETYEPTSIS